MLENHKTNFGAIFADSARIVFKKSLLYMLICTCITTLLNIILLFFLYKVIWGNKVVWIYEIDFMFVVLKFGLFNLVFFSLFIIQFVYIAFCSKNDFKWSKIPFSRFHIECFPVFFVSFVVSFYSATILITFIILFYPEGYNIVLINREIKSILAISIIISFYFYFLVFSLTLPLKIIFEISTFRAIFVSINLSLKNVFRSLVILTHFVLIGVAVIIAFDVLFDDFDDDWLILHFLGILLIFAALAIFSWFVTAMALLADRIIQQNHAELSARYQKKKFYQDMDDYSFAEPIYDEHSADEYIPYKDKIDETDSGEIKEKE